MTELWKEAPVISNLFRGGGVALDGSDYMTASSLTGQADSKLFTFSCWFYVDSSATGGAQGIFYSNDTTSGAGFIYLDTTDSRIYGRWRDASGGHGLQFYCTDVLSDDEWHHLLFSVDMADGPASRWVLDDTLLTNGSSSVVTPGFVAIQQFVNVAMDFTPSDGWAIGATPTGGNTFDGNLAEVWAAPGQYIDVSSESNRRKFIDVNGRPVILGNNGSKPTGTAPLAYTRIARNDNASDFATNRAGNGDFTITGTLALSAGEVKLP